MRAKDFGECVVTGDLLKVWLLGWFATKTGQRAFATAMVPAGLDIDFFGTVSIPMVPIRRALTTSASSFSIDGHVVRSGDVTVGDSDNVLQWCREVKSMPSFPILKGRLRRESLEAVIANGATYMKIAV